jgi:hypothetical protein
MHCLPGALMLVVLPVSAATITAAFDPDYVMCPGVFTPGYFGPLVCPDPNGRLGPLRVTIKPDAGELPLRVVGDRYGYDGDLYVVASYQGNLFAYSTRTTADFWPWQWQGLPAGTKVLPPTGTEWPLTTDVPFWGLPRSAFYDGSAQMGFAVYLGDKGNVSNYASLKGLHIYAGFKAPGTVITSTAELVEVLATPNE